MRRAGWPRRPVALARRWQELRLRPRPSSQGPGAQRCPLSLEGVAPAAPPEAAVGAAVGGAGRVAAAAAALEAAPADGEIWVALGSRSGLARGQEVLPPPAEARRGAVGFSQVRGEAVAARRLQRGEVLDYAGAEAGKGRAHPGGDGHGGWPEDENVARGSG